MARGDKAIRDAERAFEAEPTSENKEQFMTAADRGSYGPYDHLVGKFVVIHGVRVHFRGKLVEAVRRGERYYLHLNPCYEVISFRNQQWHKLEHGNGEDMPGVIPDHIACITLQPKEWPQE